jgi:hypothetical protein
MRLPSVEALVAAARRTLIRFPTVIAAGALAALAGSLAVNAAESVDEEFWLRLMGTAALAIPLFVAIDLTSERHRWSTAVRAALWTAGGALLAWFMAAWSHWSEPVAGGRYVQLSATFHLLVAVAPFIGTGAVRGFWQYNKTLFLRALIAALFSAVLYAGLAIALLALDNLFGLDVEPEWYVRLMVTLAFVFNTWLFLGGVPEDLAALEQEEDYPRGLKIFAQYVLVPLVAVYLVILTLYLVKVLVTQQWPSGWIGWLVSSVAAAGIFSLLLVHPIAGREENRWMRTYARGFYVALFPSIVMLWLAIYQRVAQYGITERRYFLAILSLWLAGIAVYYAVTRSRDIRVIPATLCIGALLTYAGPWGAYQVSEASQVGRLEDLLQSHGLLADGRIEPASTGPPYEDGREINAILRYLVGTHGIATISPWFGESLSAADTVSIGPEPAPAAEVEDRVSLLTGLMGVEYVGRWAPTEGGAFTYFANWDRQPLDIAGYDVAVRVRRLTRDSAVVEGELVVRYDSTAAAVELMQAGELLVTLPLRPAVDRAARAAAAATGRGIPPAALRLDAETPEFRVAAYLSSVSGEWVDERIRITNLEVQLFYSRSGR